MRSVVYGDDGIFAGMKDGATLIDNTTASAELARELAEAASEKGFKFVDAPVSGGQAGAENGALTVMCGGDQADFDAAKPVIECYAKMVGLMGPAGSGQLTKMMNQICIAGLVQGLSEAIAFGQNAGLDIENVVSVISKGAAGSWQMENRHKTMNEGHYDHGFAVEWMRKDLAICLAEAKRNGSKLPVTALVDQFYAEVEAMGGKRWDTSSLLARLNRLRRAAAPASRRVVAADAELVTVEVAEIGPVVVRVVVRPEAGRSLAASAGGDRGGVRLVDRGA